MTVIGLPLGSFILWCIPFVEVILGIIWGFVGKYEGQDAEEKLGEENWYRTF